MKIWRFYGADSLNLKPEDRESSYAPYCPSFQAWGLEADSREP